MNLKLSDILPASFFEERFFGFAEMLRSIVNVWDELCFSDDVNSLYYKVKNFALNFDFLKSSIISDLFSYYFGTFEEFGELGRTEQMEIENEQKKYLLLLPYIRSLKGTNAGVNEFMYFLKVYQYTFEPLLVREITIGSLWQGASSEYIKIGDFIIGQPLVYSEQNHSGLENNFYPSFYYRLLVVSTEYIIDNDVIIEKNYSSLAPALFSAKWLNFIIKFLLNRLLPFYIDIVEWFVGDILLSIKSRITFLDALSSVYSRLQLSLFSWVDTIGIDFYRTSTFSLADHMRISRFGIFNRLELNSFFETLGSIISKSFVLSFGDSVSLSCAFFNFVNAVSVVLPFLLNYQSEIVSLVDSWVWYCSYVNQVGVYSSVGAVLR